MVILSIVSFIMGLVPMTGCSPANDGGQLQVGQTIKISGKYHNPIIDVSLPDPSVIKAHDGHFYLYATENIRNLPIYRSDNLVNWDYVGTAFDDESRPKWNPNGRIWAPDINYFDGRYVLYYSKSVWGGEWTCGIGVATSVSPEGPFTDYGALFVSEDIGVRNSIDPFFLEDNGKKYVFWGSFHGIYGIELTDDGLAVRPGSSPIPIAGNQMEGTYIHKRGDYYYLFGSNGSCCEGSNSNYQVVYGRSKSLWGPYMTKEGNPMLEGHYNVLLHGNEKVAGPGHNAEFITDDKGQDWMIYHGYLKIDPDAGRQVFMDKVDWIDGWPVVEGGEPSVHSNRPSIEGIISQ